MSSTHNMSMFVLLAVAFLALAQAQECPKVNLVTNFDLDSYAQGVWYEIGRYTNNLEKYGNCVVSNYTKRGNNDYVIEVSEEQNGKRIVYDGLIDLSTDDHLKGIVNYLFLDGKSNYKIPMSFLVVDYKSYAIKYMCSYNPATKTKNVLAWVMSRTKQLTPSDKAAIDKYLASSKVLDQSKFFWDSFSDDSCKFTDSSIDRTLPKRMS